MNGYIPTRLVMLTKFLVFILLVQACASNTKEVSEKSVFVENLLSQMTLEEKIGQLHQITSQWNMTGPAPSDDSNQNHLKNLKSGKVGSMLNVVGAEATFNAQTTVVENSRLGIPLIFGYDVIHGYQTMFPIPLGEAASWDPKLLELSASIAAKEAAAAGLHWTFAPMMDVGRDARWGRVMEGAGEDPYLASVLSAARVVGFQGDSLNSFGTIAACSKHFAGYAFAEAGRDYNTVDISDATLHNVVLPPFHASVDAGVATFMNSFNTIQGVPATANDYIQRELLKGIWGFDGFVVSDWNSIGEMIYHSAARDKKDAAYLGMKGGSDMDMEGYAYTEHLEELIEEGKIDAKLIDQAARRVLTIKYRLGLFDDPYKYSDEAREKEVIYAVENRTIARKVARESMVLLKNEGDLLPIKSSVKSIAVIGPLADDKDTPLGNWRAKAIPNSAVSVLEGIKAAAPEGVKVNYALGCRLVTSERSFAQEITINETDRSEFKAAIAAAKKSEIVILAIGEDCFQSGEARSQAHIELRGVQLDLFKAIQEVNPNIIVTLMNGRPVAIPEIAEKSAAILETWFGGSEAGHAVADILFGKYNPSGKLPMTFPRSTGQVPIYYNQMTTGRPGPNKEVFWSHYIDESNDPMYPFGYGLSYTQFAYDNLKIDTTDPKSIKATVELTNTGTVAGQEVAQLYIRDKVASLVRPIKELKGFQKVALDPEASKTLTFTLTDKELGFYDNEGVFKVESGVFDVMIGTSSVDLLTDTFELK